MGALAVVAALAAWPARPTLVPEPPSNEHSTWITDWGLVTHFD